MGASCHRIACKFELFELWHSDLQGFLDFCKARPPGSFICPSNSLQETLSERIVFQHSSLYRISKAKKLGYQMQICDRLKETHDISKIRVDVYLFEEGLRKAILIFVVVFIGPIEDRLITFPDLLVGEISLAVAPRFLSKPTCIAPQRWSLSDVGEVHLYRDLGISSCR